MSDSHRSRVNATKIAWGEQMANLPSKKASAAELAFGMAARYLRLLPNL
jgi:hypothetical protein